VSGMRSITTWSDILALNCWVGSGASIKRVDTFVRISRRKYIMLSARDFEHEHHFAQYYADLVRMKYENT
jgi:hypothetical protein